MAQNHNRNAVATYTSQDVMIPAGFDENVDLIIQTYAKDLTPQEMSLFAADAHQRGLSIVKRQIYATKYNGKMTIMVGIDGYRSQAESHPDYAGQDGPYWCGEDGQWHDVWLSSDPPMAAKVGIYRKGFQAPVYGIALWSEYNNPSNPSWRKFPTTMLAKCSEALAIRKAFPSKLGGTYISEEMDQANAVETTARVVNQQTGEIDWKAEVAQGTRRMVEQAVVESTISNSDDRQKARAHWHITLKDIGIDDAGKAAWYARKGVTSSNDVEPDVLRDWARDFKAKPDAARAYIAQLLAAQTPQDAPGSTESDDVIDVESTPVTPSNVELNFSEDVIPTPANLAAKHTN